MKTKAERIEIAERAYRDAQLLMSAATHDFNIAREKLIAVKRLSRPPKLDKTGEEMVVEALTTRWERLAGDIEACSIGSDRALPLLEEIGRRLIHLAIEKRRK